MKPVINYIAVVVSAVAKFTLGAIWYGVLFDQKWMELTGMTEAKAAEANMGVTYGGAFVSYALQAYILAHFVDYAKAQDAKGGAQTGFWLWLGFTFVLLVQGTLFEQRSWTLLFINAGYELVSLLLMGIILASWKKKSPATA